MKSTLQLACLSAVLTSWAGTADPAPRQPVAPGSIVPPAAPLVACDPYFSIWSPADELNGADTIHWTGKPHRLAGLVRIDGQPFRVIGSRPAEVPAMRQTGLRVLPTSTVYHFTAAGVELTLIFTTPALPDDIAVLSRPVTYLTWNFRATDGAEHDVSFYFDAAAELTVNEHNQQVVWEEQAIDGLAALRIGSHGQNVLGRKGDDLRIDWGYLYTAAPAGPGLTKTVASGETARASFAAGKPLPPVDARQPREAGDDMPAAALGFELGKVGSDRVSRWMMLAYDDLYSIQFMKNNLRPYWRRDGWEAADLLTASAREYPALMRRCMGFNRELMGDLRQAGGDDYAKLCALAYRHCFAAGKFVADANGQAISFCKENHSNGCIGTSDVFYPMSPQFLLFGPTVAKSFLVPFMEYASSARWKFPFAPHDIGTYPLANGQVYGGGERSEQNQMPVEESGNLLILMGAVSQMDGNTSFADRYWGTLEKWAAYLKDKGFDPDNQLCTDDFAGHMAHNVNLSVKAICGLGSFAKMCEMRGDKELAAEYSGIAREYAARWLKEADDGGHFRLAFDRPGSWSQKYNLVWDRLLGLGLFPASVAEKEMAFYRTMQNKYGLPLDNRRDYTKLDWILWTATLTGKQEDFNALLQPVVRFLNETPDRLPMTDWYYTKSGRKEHFTARPVVGGVFLKTLYDAELWKKWAGRDVTKARDWAPLPVPPEYAVIVPAADSARISWRHTTNRPADGWQRPDFDDSSWSLGEGGFGTRQTPGAIIGTRWNTDDIWLRRVVEVGSAQIPGLCLWLHHDEDVTIYVNGTEIHRAKGYVSGYDAVPLSAEALAAFKPGVNVVAVHCHQRTGGQYVDLGFVREVKPAKP